MMNPGEELGPYQIVAPLGRGGMGAVYRAVDRVRGETVAVKLLSPALADEQGFRDRFLTEVETLLKLHHPNIVRLLGYGEQNGQLFYAMELIEGDSLEDELSRGRRFSPLEVVQFAFQVCQALRHAHDRGIIHRDLKPGNLLLTATGLVKLADFGIARLFNNTRRTAAGSILGTAEFMAPEQAEGKPVDPRTDLYSLGAVLYLMLARRPMFRAQSLLEMLDKQRHELPKPLGQYAPDCPAELQKLVMQLVEKRPDKRPATALAVSRRLTAIEQDIQRMVEQAASALPETIHDEHLPPSVNLEPSAASQRLAPHCEPLALSSGALSAPNPPTDSRPPEHEASGPGYSADAAAVCPTLAASAASFGAAPLRGRDSAEGPTVAANIVPAAQQPDCGGGTARGPGTALGDNTEQRSGCDFQLPTAALGAPLPETPKRSASTGSGRFVAVSPEQLDPMPEEEKANPFAVSLWTLLLAAALAGVGTVAWYLLQPPSADALFDRIHARAIEGGAMLEAAEPDIEEFLMRYPKDTRTATLREYQREIELRRLERRFDRRAKGLFGTENLLPIERAYFEAISVARTDIDAGIARLTALLELFADSQGDPGPQGLCLELARRRLEQLTTEAGRAGGDLQAMLAERLAAARAARQSDPRKAQRIYRALITLYGSKPWAARAVAEAKAAMAEIVESNEKPSAASPDGVSSRTVEDAPSQPPSPRERTNP